MSLQAEYEACMEAYDRAVVEYTDFDGSNHTVYREGWERIAERMGQLEELITLRQPINRMEWECSQYGCDATQAEVDAYHAYCNQEEPK